MLKRRIQSIFFFACATTFVACPLGVLAQQQPQQQNQQYTTPQLTPEQQAAQQQAAQQAYAEQMQRQQEAGAVNQPLAGPQQLIQPEGFPLDAEHTKYLNDLLDYWEQNSKRVEKYKCGFRRYEYDTEMVNWRDPNSNRLAAHRVTMGEIRFAAPDRARYETTQVMQFSKPPQQAGGQAEYKEVEDQTAQEKWICDGESLYDFDYTTERLYETKIPKDMQGNVTESPLPFIFGAEKKVILERYWVRVVTPAGVENEYWLELFPKRGTDRQNYSKLEVVIAKEDFLPKAMHMYSAQYDPSAGNETSRYFLFENREVNSQLAKFSDFFGGFIRPKLPRGWKLVDTQVGTQAQLPTPPATNR